MSHKKEQHEKHENGDKKINEIHHHSKQHLMLSITILRFVHISLL